MAAYALQLSQALLALLLAVQQLPEQQQQQNAPPARGPAAAGAGVRVGGNDGSVGNAAAEAAVAEAARRMVTCLDACGRLTEAHALVRQLSSSSGGRN